MKNIYQNLNDLSSDFDCFVFDAFGVFWSGDKFYPRVLKLMKGLMEQGKTVFILSNTTQMSKENSQKYHKFGMIKGVHYNQLFTAGDVGKYILDNNKLHFKNNYYPQKYYTLFNRNDEPFKDSNFKRVNKASEADFAFISTPRILKKQKNIFDKYKDFLKVVEHKEVPSKSVNYDAFTIDPFLPDLKKLRKLNIPFFNFNPDKFTPDGAVRQGLLTQEYKKLGGEVVEIGKPDIRIYKFALKNIGCPKNKILMIGDTIYTDIKGANNFGIKSVLILEHGITARDVFDGKNIDEKKLQNILKKEKAMPDFFIRKIA